MKSYWIKGGALYLEGALPGGKKPIYTLVCHPEMLSFYREIRENGQYYGYVGSIFPKGVSDKPSEATWFRFDAKETCKIGRRDDKLYVQIALN